MKLSHFNFELPDELLAEYPAENRDESRLMVLNRKEQTIEHKMFKDLIDYFDEDDVMILNDTKVFPRRKSNAPQAGQLLSQFSRYMGHVANNIGGVYEHYKTADQAGAVYTYVDKEHQKNALEFINVQLFKTPQWLLDPAIFERIEYSGSIERIRRLQERSLKTILSLGKMARMIENETMNDYDAYTLRSMIRDLRTGIWSELYSGRKIDTYRRNLQRAHIDRLAYLMTAENQSKRRGSDYVKSTAVNTSQSDIRAIVRAELITLKNLINSSISKTVNSMNKIHLRDAVERVNLILDPK